MPIGGYIPIVTTYSGVGHQSETELTDEAHWRLGSELQHKFTDQSCVKALGAEAWQCSVPTLVYKHVSAPLLVLESQIDNVIMFGFSDAPYPTGKDIPAVDQV